MLRLCKFMKNYFFPFKKKKNFCSLFMLHLNIHITRQLVFLEREEKSVFRREGWTFRKQSTSQSYKSLLARRLLQQLDVPTLAAVETKRLSARWALLHTLVQWFCCGREEKGFGDHCDDHGMTYSFVRCLDYVSIIHRATWSGKLASSASTCFWLYIHIFRCRSMQRTLLWDQIFVCKEIFRSNVLESLQNPQKLTANG